MIFTVSETIHYTIESEDGASAIARRIAGAGDIIGSASYRASQNEATKPIPKDDWPIWAKALAMISKPEDKGIGDVVARTVGAESSEAFKKWFKATTGKDCGCTGRQRRWNIEYPL